MSSGLENVLMAGEFDGEDKKEDQELGTRMACLHSVHGTGAHM